MIRMNMFRSKIVLILLIFFVGCSSGSKTKADDDLSTKEEETAGELNTDNENEDGTNTDDANEDGSNTDDANEDGSNEDETNTDESNTDDISTEDSGIENGPVDDLIISSNEKFGYLQEGTSAIQTLSLFDLEKEVLIDVIEFSLGNPIWSEDGSMLAVEVGSNTKIGDMLEIDFSPDLMVWYMEDLSKKIVVPGLSDGLISSYNWTEEGLSYSIQNLESKDTSIFMVDYNQLINKKIYSEYREDKLFFNIPTLLTVNQLNIDTALEVQKFIDYPQLDLSDEFVEKIINDALNALVWDNTKMQFASNNPLSQGKSVIGKYDYYLINNEFISFIFEFEFSDEQLNPIQTIFDSITFSIIDGMIVTLDSFYTAEEKERSFNRYVELKVEEMGIELDRPFEGLSENTKFYLVSDGIILYYPISEYKTLKDSPLEIKMTFEELIDVIRLDDMIRG